MDDLDFAKPFVNAHHQFVDFKLQQEIACLENWLAHRRAQPNTSPSLLATFEKLMETRKNLLSRI